MTKPRPIKGIGLHGDLLEVMRGKINGGPCRYYVMGEHGWMLPDEARALGEWLIKAANWIDEKQLERAG